MIYRLLRDAVEKFGRAVTTQELINYTKSVIPMCADHVPHHLPLLHRYGLVEKRLDKEKRAIYWEPTKPYRTETELAEKYPELLLESLYYHAVSEEVTGKPIPLNYVIELLYEISGGSEKRPTLLFIKRLLQRVKERRPDLFQRMTRDIEAGVDPKESEVVAEVKRVIKELKLSDEQPLKD